MAIIELGSRSCPTKLLSFHDSNCLTLFIPDRLIRNQFKLIFEQNADDKIWACKRVIPDRCTHTVDNIKVR